jgi:nicotinate-nucleotide pyrophosphorylase (carboxylating)
MPSGRLELAVLIEEFLREDVGRGDVTTRAVVAPGARARGTLLARTDLVVCGLPEAETAFRALDPAVEFVNRADEGGDVLSGSTLASLAGNARAILSAERVALNLLQRMCGIATATRRYVEAVAGTGCRILDTRKTAPGLRAFDRLAVEAGGGKNHRFGLDDGVLIKDNHLCLSGGVSAAIAAARDRASAMLKIEVEVESEEQLREAADAGADIVLFDNQTPENLARLVAMARTLRPGMKLEASGGIILENVHAYAATGVDFISVGALTHSVKASDISLELAAG